LRNFFGKEEINEPVNNVMKGALSFFEEGGAVLIEVTDNIDSDEMIRNASVHLDDFKTHLNGYLSGLRADAPFTRSRKSWLAANIIPVLKIIC